MWREPLSADWERYETGSAGEPALLFVYPERKNGRVHKNGGRIKQVFAKRENCGTLRDVHNNNFIVRQSRRMRVKCRLYRELTAGRKEFLAVRMPHPAA